MTPRTDRGVCDTSALGEQGCATSRRRPFAAIPAAILVPLLIFLIASQRLSFDRLIRPHAKYAKLATLSPQIPREGAKWGPGVLYRNWYAGPSLSNGRV